MSDRHELKCSENFVLYIHFRNQDFEKFPWWFFLRHWPDESRKSDPRFSRCISLSRRFGGILDFRVSDRSKTRHKSTKTEALNRTRFDLGDLAVPSFHFRLDGNETAQNPLFQWHPSRTYLAIISNRKVRFTPASRIDLCIRFSMMINWYEFENYIFGHLSELFSIPK